MQDANRKQGDTAADGAMLTRSDAVRALGISKGMLSVWTRQGCPVIYLGKKCTYGTGARARWILADVKAWLAARSHAQSGKEAQA